MNEMDDIRLDTRCFMTKMKLKTVSLFYLGSKWKCRDFSKQ